METFKALLFQDLFSLLQYQQKAGLNRYPRHKLMIACNQSLVRVQMSCWSKHGRLDSQKSRCSPKFLMAHEQVQDLNLPI